MERAKKIWRRLGSTFVDLSLINMIGTIILWFFSPLGFLTLTNLMVDLMLIVIYLLLLVFISYYYQRFMINKYDRSFGKMILNQTILNEKQKAVDKKVLYEREFKKYYLLYSTLGLYGIYCLILILFTNKKFPHEKMYDAYVVDL